MLLATRAGFTSPTRIKKILLVTVCFSCLLIALVLGKLEMFQKVLHFQPRIPQIPLE